MVKGLLGVQNVTLTVTFWDPYRQQRIKGEVDFYEWGSEAREQHWLGRLPPTEGCEKNDFVFGGLEKHFIEFDFGD